jgi:hypothetical protein
MSQRPAVSVPEQTINDVNNTVVGQYVAADNRRRGCTNCYHAISTAGQREGVLVVLGHSFKDTVKRPHQRLCPSPERAQVE